jgi:hypothetical protein
MGESQSPNIEFGDIYRLVATPDGCDKERRAVGASLHAMNLSGIIFPMWIVCVYELTQIGH